MQGDDEIRGSDVTHVLKILHFFIVWRKFFNAGTSLGFFMTSKLWDEFNFLTQVFNLKYYNNSIKIISTS